MTPPRQWSIVELVDWTANYLKERKVENSRLEVEWLLAHVLKMSRIDLYLNFDRPLTPAELSAFKRLLKRRLTHEPVQYLVGETEFMSLSLYVSPDVLIPRPETEILVEKALEWTDAHFREGEPLISLDVGTGSGNVAVSFAHYCAQARMVAIDLQESVLAIARKNASRHQVEDRIDFHKADLQSDWSELSETGFDLILSNPPYISQSEFDALESNVRDFEPRTALLAGSNGLDFYPILAERIHKVLRAPGAAFVEIGASQGDLVKQLFQDSGFPDPQIIKDLAGRDRILFVDNRSEQ